jgi:hypothetical protein
MKDQKFLQSLHTILPNLDGGASVEPDDVSALPEGLTLGPGWRQDEQNRPYIVAKYPNQFRTVSEKYSVDEWPYRSTWILVDKVWKQIESACLWQ